MRRGGKGPGSARAVPRRRYTLSRSTPIGQSAAD
jgi:hypothetical protein